MGNPYVGEIRMFAGNFAPAGWAFCQGQLIPIAENDALFVLLGTRYGGDGQSTFALPDLRGRVPMHTDALANQGEAAGVQDVTLTANQIPQHTHNMLGSTVQGNLPDPGNHVVARSSTPSNFRYQSSEPSDVTMNLQSIGPAGGSQPHTNVQPYLCLNFIISLYGVFPTAT
jgi:microcystin-dependent protein